MAEGQQKVITLDDKVNDALDAGIDPEEINGLLLKDNIPQEEIDSTFDRVLQRRSGVGEPAFGAPEAISEGFIERPEQALAPAGAIAGAVLVGPFGGMLGGGIGESLAVTSEFTRGAPGTPESLGEQVQEGLFRVGAETLLQGFGGGGKALVGASRGKFLRKHPDVVKEIKQVAKRLGVDFKDVPLSMLTRSSREIVTEATLVKKGAAAGSGRTAKVREVINAMSRSADDIKASQGLIGDLTAVDFSETAKGQLLANIGQKFKPISEKFQSIVPKLKEVEVTPGETGIRALESPADSLGTSDGGILQRITERINTKDLKSALGSTFDTMVSDLEARLRTLNNLNALKEWRSVIGRRLKQKITPEERKMLEIIDDELDAFNDFKIVASAKNKNFVQGIELQHQLAEAKEQWATATQELRTLIKRLTGKKLNNVEEIKSYLDELSEQQFHKFMTSLWRNGSLKDFQLIRKLSPDAFETLRVGKLQDMFAKAQITLDREGQRRLGKKIATNPIILSRQLDDLSDGAIDLLFGTGPTNKKALQKDLVDFAREIPTELDAVVGRSAKEGAERLVLSDEAASIPTQASQAGLAALAGFESSVLRLGSRLLDFTDKIFTALPVKKAGIPVRQTGRELALQLGIHTTGLRDLTKPQPSKRETIGGFDVGKLINLDALPPEVQRKYVERLQSASRGTDPFMDSVEAAKRLDLYNKHRMAPLDELNLEEEIEQLRAEAAPLIMRQQQPEQEDDLSGLFKLFNSVDSF
jgi:hypothetical protein